MKIVNKTEPRSGVQFLTIKQGECFLYKGKVYMRTNLMAPVANNGTRVVGANNNTVNIEDGKGFPFYSETVTPIEGVFSYEVKP